MEQDTENKRIKKNAQVRAYSSSEAGKAKRRAYYAANRDRILAVERARTRAARHLEKALLARARSRAKRLRLAFDIELCDIVVPEFCPVLGLRLRRSLGKHSPSSPSLDRVRSALGYVKGNVQVISWRANSVKSDGSEWEHAQIAAYIARHRK